MHAVHVANPLSRCHKPGTRDDNTSILKTGARRMNQGTSIQEDRCQPKLALEPAL